jgi:hypothetical protein
MPVLPKYWMNRFYGSDAHDSESIVMRLSEPINYIIRMPLCLEVYRMAACSHPCQQAPP